MMHLSISPELARDLARVALKSGISASEYVRKAVAEKLSLETGKEYQALQWGGARRPGAGRKPAQSAPPRRPVPADGEIKPRSRNAAAAGTKKRRSSAA